MYIRALCSEREWCAILNVESVQTSFKNETRQAFYVEHSDLTSWRREVLPSFPAAEEGRSCSPADVQNVMCVTEFASEYAREEILLQLGR